MKVDRRRFRHVASGLCILTVLWFVAMLLLRDAIARSKVLLTVLVVAIVLLVALIRTLRCPVCGAFVARQVPLWRFPQFKCAKCGYSADEN